MAGGNGNSIDLLVAFTYDDGGLLAGVHSESIALFILGVSMLIGLHGIFILVVNLLFVASATALSSRLHKRFWRRLWPLLMAGFLFLGLLTGVICGAYLLQQKVAPSWFFGYSLTLLILHGAGSVLVLRRGLREMPNGLVAAAGWKRMPLLVALGLASVLSTMILEQMQTQTMLDLVRVQNEASGKLMRLMPAAVPDAVNARLRYEAAIDALERIEPAPDWLTDSLAPGADPGFRRATDFLSANADLIDSIKIAAAMPTYAPDLTGSSFYTWPMPDLSGYRQLAAVLSLEARIAALAGDVNAALNTLVLLRSMAGHLENGPFLISHILANLIEEMRVRSLEFILANGSVASARLNRDLNTPRVSTLNRFRLALCREAYGQLQGLAFTAATPDLQATERRGATALLRPNALTRMWRAYFLPSDLAAARDIVTERMCRPAESFDDIRDNMSVIRQARETGKMGILSAISAPDYDGILARAMRHDALLQLERVALGAYAYKDRYGHWPETAEDLIPEFIDRFPVSSYDGQPVNMVTVKEGLDLFCADPLEDEATTKSQEVHFYLGESAYAAAVPKAIRP